MFVAAAAVAVTSVLLLPPKGESYHWIRKYGGFESRKQIASTEEVDIYVYDFTFEDIPSPLIDEMEVRLRSLTPRGFRIDKPGIAMIAYRDKGWPGVGSDHMSEGEVSIVEVVPINWLERQWRALKTKLGSSESAYKQSEAFDVRP